MLRTLSFEVAGLLNSRPLTYTSSDSGDLWPFTPNDLLNRPSIAHGSTSTLNTDTALLKERFKYVKKKLHNLFWDQAISAFLGKSKQMEEKTDISE